MTSLHVFYYCPNITEAAKNNYHCNHSVVSKYAQASSHFSLINHTLIIMDSSFHGTA